MLWEVEICPTANEIDREGLRIAQEARALGAATIRNVRSARSFLLQGPSLTDADVRRAAATLLVDPVAETFSVTQISKSARPSTEGPQLNVLFKPGVTDNVAFSTKKALLDLKFSIEAVATVRRYWFEASASPVELERLSKRVLANDAIERVVVGPLAMEGIGAGSEYKFERRTVAIRSMNDDELMSLSKHGQLYLSLAEMRTIQQHWVENQHDPSDIELETVAQTWSEHCSHKTLKGRIRYRDERGERLFENLLKETVFGATVEIRRQLGADDWCVSVFKDNAGVVTFDEKQHVCFKVETHNHPSAIEPYGGANTGIGGVIRDPLGTGLGARPILNTDVFCFASPETPVESLPPGVLHPKLVMKGVVSGVRDYGNRMGIPTVNGAVFFDERYLGNPLVYCGTAAMIPVDKVEKQVEVGDLIVAVGGRTGRDGIHGATFSSAELTEESETVSGGAVQIGNAVVEKMVADVVLQARDLGLYHAITDCGAGGFSSAVGEMGEEIGAVVWLEKCPLKYAGLSYTEIWISEAQERMVLAVPPDNWEQFHFLCAAEGVEASVIGQFGNEGRLKLTYEGETVGDVAMSFLHEGRPQVVREAVYTPVADAPLMGQSPTTGQVNYDSVLRQILGSLNVCSKEWIIRQYDHEVQSGSVIKPLVGLACDGPSDAAVVRPDLTSNRGVVVSNGMNPYYGDFDPYWMAAAAIDEAVRNCVAVGADPRRIAILDNFCWGNTERPETLGSLVRAALGCRDVAIAFGTPFISGKDSLNNEFSYVDSTSGEKRTVTIPSSLLISAIGQVADVRHCVTMDLKQAGNHLYLVGETRDEMGGSHYALVNQLKGGRVPRVDLQLAPRIFHAMHEVISTGLVRSTHDLSEGGLATSAAEMAFAGGLGVDLDLTECAKLAGLSDPALVLFSESPTRFLVEVEPASVPNFEAAFEGLPLAKVGVVTHSNRVHATLNGQPVLGSACSELKAAWSRPLAWD
ncbi:phosphoribosylformylglycinamidine synthase subunit PurL [Schlesneria paludicola]|uniref:phosphoribosylformylglycinamidine synthase subunit PurL n=1 Tax=Schlesneria paludicola TaxID=360056 RepID=UPI00029B4E30|nr:phosphoribosylformylglycinamidine synthase subunit PurL [Schlesneria paludicola]